MSTDSRSSSKLKKLYLSDSYSEMSNFFKDFKELFSKSFIANCHIDDASITQEELETLEELDNHEVLENMRDLIESLLSFKTNCKSDGEGEIGLRCEQLEKLLQKQESEVRAHIRNEHELKLYLDTVQQKLLDLEVKYCEAQASIKEMEKCGFESMQTKLKKLESGFQSELNRIAERYRANPDSNQTNEKYKKLEEMYEQKERSYIKLQQDFNKIKILLEETTKQCKALKKEIGKYGIGVISNDVLTRRKEEVIERHFTKSHITSKSSTQNRSKGHFRQRSDDINRQYRFVEPTPPQHARSSSIVKSANFHSYIF
ncbi:hypothetical protein SteCoe_22861 [Stentor coeruleus]|uniref:Uncharacterized protein n=1 Tax=Stentor coeruleus TaxID=5963 RepID=A0A1R2BLE0_9CILI|nr:hypothetical protein SteCoe_22861 [Stentor coeruleus]